MNRVLRSRLRRKALVTLKTGGTFRGVLWESDREALVLRNAEQLEAGTDRVPVPVDGELVVLMGDVLLIQML